MSEWIVLKFGGTSVSSLARWQTLAEVVSQRLDDGHRPFVVCSALSGISNALEQLLAASIQGTHEPLLAEIRQRHTDLAADLEVDGDALLTPLFEQLTRLALGASLIREVSPRLQAQVMATGELMATQMGAAYLERQGLATRWCDARAMLQAVDAPGLSPNRRYLSAACDFRHDPALQEELAGDEAKVFLTQGFIASNPAGETVLLGRGGSDTSAACFAAKLGAVRLEIWTDVPGLFTANPRQIPSARLLGRLDYDEAQELATMGARVLHPRCIEPVRQYHIPLHIRCTEAPAMEGTVISDDTPDFGAQVKAISAKAGITLISMDAVGMWQQVGFLADVFGAFKRSGLSIDLVATSETNVTVSLDAQANALDPAALQALLHDLNALCRAREIGPCAVVSLVGRNIRSVLHELGPALEVFEEQHIYLVSQAASDLNLSFVVDEEQAGRIMRKLHAQLFGERAADGPFGPTWRELFSEEHQPGHGSPVWWRARRDELLALAEAASPRYVYDEETLRLTVASLRSVEAVDCIFYAMKANPNPDVLRLFYEEGLGFECVSPGEIERVLALFPDIDRRRLLFTPNFAPRSEYAYGFESGAYITLDNLYPLEAWPELFRGRGLFVRVDPGRGHGHHKYVRTAGAQSKFGVWPSELERLADLLHAVDARVIGLHAHLGSGIKTPETWAQTAVFLASLTDVFEDVQILNLGGGLGVPERTGLPPIEISAIAESLATFKAANPQFTLWMEPGRYLVAGAGVLLARVTQLKQKGRVHYVGLDAGLNSLIRPALYGAYHEIVNLSRLDAPSEITAEVVGPICETGDVLGHGRRLPATEEGDVLLIATAGAYGHAMSSHYNLREPAAEVLLPMEEHARV